MSRPRYPTVLRSLLRRSRVLQIVLLILFSLLGQVLQPLAEECIHAQPMADDLLQRVQQMAHKVGKGRLGDGVPL